MTDRELGLSLLGKLVVFNHEPANVSPAMVISCDRDGMIELMGWSGKFGPHLFKLADKPAIAKKINEGRQ